MEIRIPPLSESVSTATLMAWHKQEGDFVERDEILIEVETDKAEFEHPPPPPARGRGARVRQRPGRARAQGGCAGCRRNKPQDPGHHACPERSRRAARDGDGFAYEGRAAGTARAGSRAAP